LFKGPRLICGGCDAAGGSKWRAALPIHQVFGTRTLRRNLATLALLKRCQSEMTAPLITERNIERDVHGHIGSNDSGCSERSKRILTRLECR